MKIYNYFKSHKWLWKFLLFSFFYVILSFRLFNYISYNDISSKINNELNINFKKNGLEQRIIYSPSTETKLENIKFEHTMAFYNYYDDLIYVTKRNSLQSNKELESKNHFVYYDKDSNMLIVFTFKLKKQIQERIVDNLNEKYNFKLI